MHTKSLPQHPEPDFVELHDVTLELAMYLRSSVLGWQCRLLLGNILIRTIPVDIECGRCRCLRRLLSGHGSNVRLMLLSSKGESNFLLLLSQYETRKECAA